MATAPSNPKDLPLGHESARIDIPAPTAGQRLATFPWWFVALVLVAVGTAFIIFNRVYLFTTGVQHAAELDAGVVSDAFRAELTESQAKLSQDNYQVIVKEPGQYWQIVDGIRTYYVSREGDSLEVKSKTSYGEAFDFIRVGLSITVIVTLVAFGFALLLGLIAGLARLSRNVFLNNLGVFYVEFIRGIPMLVLIFFIALVAVPTFIESMNAFGNSMAGSDNVVLRGLSPAFLAVTNKDIPPITRAIIALAITYGAYLAEIFRAGIQSIGRGQMEAARSLGMTYGQSMRYIILPQAIRNVLPALGNDFIAMVKDSSLVSLVAAREITYMAKVYTGSSFRYREAYLVLSVMYLTITVVLSALVQQLERRMGKNE